MSAKVSRRMATPDSRYVDLSSAECDVWDANVGAAATYRAGCGNWTEPAARGMCGDAVEASGSADRRSRRLHYVSKNPADFSGFV